MMMMKAAIYDKFGGPIVVKNDVAIPIVSNDGILLKVQATGICRSDHSGWKGYDNDIHNHGLPFCPGHELSGIVVDVGSLVNKFIVGNHVVVPFILSCGSCKQCLRGRGTICCKQKQPGFTQWGSFAQYINIPRADRNVHLLPSGISFIQAAALGCRFTTAYRAIIQQGNLPQILSDNNNNNNNNGSTTTSVGIFGCGGLGLSCIMITKAIASSSSSSNNIKNNIQIIAVDVSSEALQKAKELGATHTIEISKNMSPKDIAKQVRKCRRIDDDDYDDDDDDGGIDLTLDTAGYASTSESAVYSTKAGGRMIQVGLPHDRLPSIPMNIIAGKEIEIIGSHGFDSQDLPQLLNMINNKNNDDDNDESNGNGNGMSLDPCKLIEKEVTLEEGCTILQNMDQYNSPLGIVMITKFDNDNKESIDGEKQQQGNNNNKSSSTLQSRL